MAQSYICVKCGTKHHDRTLKPECCGSLSNTVMWDEWKCPNWTKNKALEHGSRCLNCSFQCRGNLCVDCCTRKFEGEDYEDDSNYLNPEQKKRVEEQNKMNEETINRGIPDNEMMLDWKLKELGIRNLDINQIRMKENQINYILTGKRKFNSD